MTRTSHALQRAVRTVLDDAAIVIACDDPKNYHGWGGIAREFRRLAGPLA